ncbi:MAG: ATPase, T2SS/T4P/T4SS family [Methanosarcina sp.]
MLKFQETIDNLKQGHFHGQSKKKEEPCLYRIKQTKNKKTIFINCKECNSSSSLNDTHCRKNILEILQKEPHTDCLVLSRLYERDYEGEALFLLYKLACFQEIITTYLNTEKVPKACTLPEKSRCELERKQIITSFIETVEIDPLRARMQIKECIDAKMLKQVPENGAVCITCSDFFYQMLYEIEKKLNSFPEITPFQRSETPFSSIKRIENTQIPEQNSKKIIRNKENSKSLGNLENSRNAKNSRNSNNSRNLNNLENSKNSKNPADPKNLKDSGGIIENFKASVKGYEKNFERIIGKITKNLIKDTSGELALADVPETDQVSVYSHEKRQENAWKTNTSLNGNSLDEIFDYESAIKSHVRPPFSSSRIYTEVPSNTEFLECYDISCKEGRNLEVSIYSYTDRPEKLYMIKPPEYNLRQAELRLIEKVRKKMIKHRPKDLAFTDPAGAREYFRRMAKKLLEEQLFENKETCAPEELEKYADLLARYTNGLGIVEDLLSDSRITDIYINAPADTNPVHVVIDGEECVSNVFLSQDDLDSLVSRFRTISGRPFGEAVPVLELNLEAFGVRVSVIGDPLSANGLAYAFRKHSLSPWTLPKLIATGSISPAAAGLLSFLMDGQASVLVAGEVGAGKTSLLSAMLLEIPQKYRVLTIEDTNELPIEQLQALGWKVQAMSSYSSVLKSGAEMSPETALRAALRLGSSALVLGEVRGSEVKVLYEAMQVGKAGNSVIGTIHGSSIENVYERIVHTLGVPPASFKATDAVIICSAIRLEGTMKKLKRVSRIAEVTNTQVENPEPAEIFTDIMNYDAAQDCLLPGKALEQGQSELIEKISRKWGISIDRALKNIELRTRVKQRIAIEGSRKPLLLEAEAVSQANNMFWLLMDSMGRDKIRKTDYENNQDFSLEDEVKIKDDMEILYKKWELWFENFASKVPK